jgi:hypothetical protein
MRLSKLRYQNLLTNPHLATHNNRRKIKDPNREQASSIKKPMRREESTHTRRKGTPKEPAELKIPHGGIAKRGIKRQEHQLFSKDDGNCGNGSCGGGENGSSSNGGGTI